MEPKYVTIVGGAGHVGFPLGLAFANVGYNVRLVDLNGDALKQIMGGEVPFKEEGAEAVLAKVLAKKLLSISDNPQGLFLQGPVIVTIGTPVNQYGLPEKEIVPDCVRNLLPHIQDGRLLVLRSTVYPGTTGALGEELKQRGRNILLACCPERIVQGHSLKELQELPQIIGATSPEAAAEAVGLFSDLTDCCIRVPPTEAELAKLFTNTYRFVEFMMTNYFSIVAGEMSVDYHRILYAMRHQYPRAAHIPGPGLVGGPCLPKDTAQLKALAWEQGVSKFDMFLRNALEGQKDILWMIFNRIRSYGQLHGRKATVGLLGMAFKAENDDSRGSPGYQLKKILKNYGFKALCTDPFVKDNDLVSLNEVVEKCDILVLCVPHDCYLDVVFHGKPVIDVWGAL